MYLDSPLEVCPRCGKYVLLDETQKECAQEHHCSCAPGECPLAGYFSGTDFGQTPPTSDSDTDKSG